MTRPASWLDHVRAGEPFQMMDMDFMDAVLAATTKVAAFNGAADVAAAQAMLPGLLGRVGANVVMLPRVTLDVGFNIEVGDNTFINQNCTLLDTYPIRIGNDVQIGPNCAFYPVGHPVRAADRVFSDAETGERRSWTTGAPIEIGDGCWIGGSVVVVAGVKIGARTTVGAGSVVTRSLPPDVFAAGNPCRVIRELAP